MLAHGNKKVFVFLIILFIFILTSCNKNEYDEDQEMVSKLDTALGPLDYKILELSKYDGDDYDVYLLKWYTGSYGEKTCYIKNEFGNPTIYIIYEKDLDYGLFPEVKKTLESKDLKPDKTFTEYEIKELVSTIKK